MNCVCVCVWSRGFTVPPLLFLSLANAWQITGPQNTDIIHLCHLLKICHIMDLHIITLRYVLLKNDPSQIKPELANKCQVLWNHAEILGWVAVIIDASSVCVNGLLLPSVRASERLSHRTSLKSRGSWEQSKSSFLWREIPLMTLSVWRIRLRHIFALHWVIIRVWRMLRNP